MRRNRWMACLSGLILAGAAQAQDFTIIVPIEIGNLDEPDRAIVQCWVSNGRVPDLWDENAPVIGAGSGSVMIPAREFVRQEVTVTFDADSDANAADANFYGCSLMMANGMSQGTPYVLSWEDCERQGLSPERNRDICGPQGAVVRGVVYGEF